MPSYLGTQGTTSRDEEHQGEIVHAEVKVQDQRTYGCEL